MWADHFESYSSFKYWAHTSVGCPCMQSPGLDKRGLYAYFGGCLYSSQHMFWYLMHYRATTAHTSLCRPCADPESFFRVDEAIQIPLKAGHHRTPFKWHFAGVYLFLSLSTGTIACDHNARECEFGIFKKKQQKATKQKTKTKQKNKKNLSAVFWLNEECPNSFVVWEFLCALRCKSQVPAKETKCLNCFGRNFWNVLTPIYIIRDSYTKVFCRLNVFQGLVVKGIVEEYVFVMLIPSQSHWVTFGHIEFHLPIGFPLS